MAHFHRSLNRRSVEARRCPVCNRGMALKWVWSPWNRQMRICRWSEVGKCSNGMPDVAPGGEG